MRFKGVFFDLDGTLVDSFLNFDSLRAELNFPKGAPILEEIEKIASLEEQEICHQVVHKHEWEGAEKSKLIPGVKETMEWLHSRKIPTGVLTRNSQVCAQHMLKKHKLSFEYLLTREDCLPKPHPEGLLKLAGYYNLNPEDCLYVGDFKFDLETAKNAGMKSALFNLRPNCTYKDRANFVFSSYQDFIPSILLS